MTVLVANNKVKKKIGSQSGSAELGAKIREFRKQTMECDQKSFAQMLGVSQAIISQWESGTYMPSAMALLAIGRLAGEDGGWWAEQAGEEYALVHTAVKNYKKAYFVDDEQNRVISIYGTAGAGPNRFPAEHAEEKISLPRSWFGHDQSIVGLRVVGDSMAPIIQDGFLALIDIHDNKDFKSLDGKIVAARDEHGVCIKWLRADGTAYSLYSQNPDVRYPPIPIKRGGYEIVGRVVKWIGDIRS